MVYENYERWKTTPIQGDPYLSIVIPAYNESERIIPTVGAIASHVSELGFDWELIVADDGSKDNTVALLQDLNLANLRVLIAEKNGGKGSAVRRGMLAARGNYILFTDADNSTPIENISTVLKKCEEGFDVTVGSRAAEGASETNKSFLRHVLSGGLRFLVRYVLNIRVKDTQCGFKMFSREAAHKIHSAQTIDGFSFDLEELYLADKCGYKVAEVAVDWMDAPGSKVDAKKEAIRFLKDMALIRWQNFKGVYDARLRAAIKTAPNLSIAVVTAYPPSTGSLNEYAYHFIEALRRKDEVKQLYILTDELKNGASYPLPSQDGALTTIIPCWTFGSWRNFWRIRRAIKVLKPDVVIFNIQFASFASSRVAGALGLMSPALVKHLNKTYTIVLLHNIMETVDLKSAGFGSNSALEWITRKAGEIVTRLLLQADLVALTIPKYVDILNTKYHAKNVFLSPHGAFDEVPEPSFSQENNDTLQIMSFGKFGTYKRIENLIGAFDILRKRHPDQRLDLVIAGSDSPNASGYLEEMKATYKDIPVTYTGYVAESDVPKIFTDSDVVVFPYTSTTGSSGVLHQAGSFGRAVVLPNIGDFAELIQEEGYIGEFFDPQDVLSLADAIDRLLVNPQLRNEQGRQNYLAARGVPIGDVVDWYLMHIHRETMQ